MKHFLFSIAFLLLAISAQSQDDFNINDLPNYLVRELNKFRLLNGLDTFEVNQILVDAATIDAEKMSESGQVKVDPEKAKKNLVKAGGTKKGEEVAMNAPISKGRDNYKTEQVAKIIWTRWENNKKDKVILLSPQYMMIGIKCVPDEGNKKAYAVAVFGGYDSFNEGAKKKKELAVPFNTKSKKLQKL
jgi:uncharacterized protein YkwD